MPPTAFSATEASRAADMHPVFHSCTPVVGSRFFIPATPARRSAFCTRFGAACIILLFCAASGTALAMGRQQSAGPPPSSLIPWQEPVVWGREYLGVVSVPDPSNLATYSRLTGEDCRVSLRPAQGLDLWVQSSFWEGEKLARADGLRGGDFYLGQLENKRVFILQTLPGKIPIDVTFTGYDASGQLVIGRTHRPRERVKNGNRSCSVRFDRGAHASDSQHTPQGQPP